MKITEHRTKEILNLLDEFADHAPMFEGISKKMFHDTAALIRQLQAEAQPVAWTVLQIGATGSAYDAPDTRRAFTYGQQPGNVLASKLGGAANAAAAASAGDSIDRGLSLLKALQESGFGVFQLEPSSTVAPPSTPVGVDANELTGVRARLKSGDYDGADVMRAWLAIDKLLALAQQPASSAPDPAAGDAVAMQPVAEVALSDDGYKIGLLGPLRAHRLPLGTKLYASPRAAISGANAPVGVEAALSLLRAGHWREVHTGRRYMRLEVTYDYAAWERLMAEVESALAQQPSVVPVGVAEAWQQGYRQGVLDERISEANIGIAGFAAKVEPARTNPYLAQQPAAVDEAMVFRMAVWMAKNDGHDDPHHLIWEGSPPEPWGEVWNRYEDDARAALTAALAAQPGGSDNDR